MLKKNTALFNLLLFRFFYCFILAYSATSRAIFFWRSKDSEVFQGLLFATPFHPDATTDFLFYGSCAVLLVSLLCFGLGLWPKISGTLSVLSYCNIFLPMNLSYRPYDDNLVVINLAILTLAPIPSLIQHLRQKALTTLAPSWPLELVKVNLALVYFSAFVSKIVNAGWSWGNGLTLQAHLYERYFMTGNAIAHFTADHLWLCTLLSIFSLFAEATFWTVLIQNRMTPFVALAGFLLHVGIYFMMSINFLVIFSLSYLVFLPYDKIYLYFKNRFSSCKALPL